MRRQTTANLRVMLNANLRSAVFNVSNKVTSFCQHVRHISGRLLQDSNIAYSNSLSTFATVVFARNPATIWFK